MKSLFQSLILLMTIFVLTQGRVRHGREVMQGFFEGNGSIRRLGAMGHHPRFSPDMTASLKALARSRLMISMLNNLDVKTTTTEASTTEESNLRLY